MKLPLLAGIALAVPCLISFAQTNNPPTAEARMYLNFVQQQAAALRGADRPPATLAEWEARRVELRGNLEQAWGGFPTTAAPLQARKLGELRRDGYRIEKIVFQTRPGVMMTANAYVPERPGRHPAVLAVHGHWPQGKVAEDLQALHLGLVKQGFFVLAVDAFGAGERGVGKALGEYHGEMTAATLWPVGLPLSGLQVYENMRAVDYLQTRAEVDPARIGVTGASGGGNQTMYAGAWDNRLAASVAVCSVGNYQAYLGVACCMCEVVPGALRFTEEWGVLGLAAPRALMVINATKDGIQFSVAEAAKSLAQARPVFELHGRGEAVKHAVFETTHGYHKPMREAMYGWMTRHLKGEGDGSPRPEPAATIEDLDSLRCYPGESRPDDFVTLPRFAAAEARKILHLRQAPTAAPAWAQESRGLRAGLLKVLGGSPPVVPLQVRTAPVPGTGVRVLTFESEAGITLTVRHEPSAAPAARLAVLLDLDGAEKAAGGELAAALRRAGWSLALPDLRATGRYDWPRNKIGGAMDHNTAQWGLWLGRPLIGQWAVDIRRALDALQERDGSLPKEITLIGAGPAGVVALCAAALDPRITGVATLGTLASYVTDSPYVGQRMGIMVPGILREVGDIPHVAALLAPRRLVVAGGVNGAGQSLDAATLRDQFDFTRKVYELNAAPAALSLGTDTDLAGFVRRL